MKLIADTTIIHNGERFEAGQEFSAADEAARQLIDSDAAHRFDNKQSKSQNDESSKTQDDSPTDTAETVEVSVKMNRTELEEAAEKAGLEGPYEQYETKADLVKAIEEHLQVG